ncbi:uncharacterized protein [Physcomitrium patens]|uniref:Uncharacterized protein n=1 Tax=Physcomitrium patens TaxID=3218 RepID=A0A2K1KI32_PHYPA|nr:uncharacterized protein LOC112282357 [Physcomitrium patens]PNR53428.1 hypothetical protein PHYPA_007103 [Physcomitrium patens]|eukprot:XP_024375633.1 uncharacterized protein LOC112282357 [Physcomitrella patens]
MSSNDFNGQGYSDGRGLGGPHDHSATGNLPIYLLFLIMLGSGIVTLIFLWICFQYICHRRRVRGAIRDDQERVLWADGAWEAGGAERARYDATSLDVKEKLGPNVKACDASVELTYVVMAGEEHPTFLARPLSKSFELPSPSSPKTTHNAQATISPKKSSPS